MNNKRFSWLAGQEYDVRAKAVPHYHTMQQTLAQKIADYFNTHTFWDLYKSIIELWTGTWYTTACICDSLNLSQDDKNIPLYSVDNEPIMLQQANMHLRAQIQSWKVCLIQKDILDYLTQPWKVLCIASAMTIHNFDVSYRSKVLEQIYYRLCRWWLFINADKYALDDTVEHQKSLDRQIQQFKKVAKETGNPTFAKERTEHYLRDNEPDLLMKQQEAIDEMEKIGFKDIQIIFRAHMEAILVARK